MAFLPETPRNAGDKLDWFGFGTLSLAIGALQIMLDRGEQKDWFGSGEIIIEAVVAASAFYLFLVHTFTAEKPFVRPSLFRDRNFAAGVLFVVHRRPHLLRLDGAAAALSAGTHGTIRWSPPAWSWGPRGVGTMASMLVVGRLVGRVDTRLLLGIGLGLTAWSFYADDRLDPGCLAGSDHRRRRGPGRRPRLPLRAAERRHACRRCRYRRGRKAPGFYNLSRNIGSSVGISVMNSLVTRNTQINHAAIVPTRHAGQSRRSRIPRSRTLWNPLTAAGRAALDAVITRQAQIIAYIDDYKLLMIATLAVIPLLMVFRKPPGRSAAEPMPVVE